MKNALKKTLAMLLVIATLLSQVSCGASGKTSLKMGQWLSMIADSFGMESYIEETPYFKKVDKNDPYFGAFQAAAEWDILPAGSDVTSETAVTWKDALVMLVNAGELADETKTDDEKFDLAVHLFDSTIRNYWQKRNIPTDKAVKYLEQAASLWATKTYDVPVEEIKLDEAVLDALDQKVTYEYQALSQDYPDMEQGEEVVVIPLKQDNTDIDYSQLKPGDVYTLPSTNESNASINKVKSVEVRDGQVFIVNDSDFTEEEALEYIEELVIQETTDIDFNKISGIYDEYGNPIDLEIVPDGTANHGDAGIRKVGIFDNAKISAKFKVGSWAVGLSKRSSELSIEISKEFGKVESRYKEKKMEAFIKATFSNVSLTKDIDYSWGTLHSATLRLDYDTTLEGGIKKTQSTEIGKHVDDGKNGTQHLSTIFNEYKDALSDIGKGVKKGVADDSIYICRIAIIEGGFASVDFIVKGKVEASGELKLVLELEGSQGVEYRKKNVRFIKENRKNVNFAAEAKLEATIGPGIAISILKKISVAEITIDCGLGVSFSGKVTIIDAKGHKLSEQSATIDGESANGLTLEKYVTSGEEILEFAKKQGLTDKDLKPDMTVEVFPGICLEWKLYPILRVGLTDGLIKKLCSKLSVKTSIEILGSKNTILKGHIDIGWKVGLTNISEMLAADNAVEGFKAVLGIGHECSFEFVPFDEYEEIAESLAEQDESMASESDYDGIPWGDQIVLSETKLIMKVGDTLVLQLEELPDGYKTSDLDVHFSDYEYTDSSGKIKTISAEDIIEFNLGKGSVTAKSPGQVILTVSTKDGKHFAACSIMVTD